MRISTVRRTMSDPMVTLLPLASHTQRTVVVNSRLLPSSRSDQCGDVIARCSACPVTMLTSSNATATGCFTSAAVSALRCSSGTSGRSRTSGA